MKNWSTTPIHKWQLIHGLDCWEIKLVITVVMCPRFTVTKGGVARIVCSRQPRPCEQGRRAMISIVLAFVRGFLPVFLDTKTLASMSKVYMCKRPSVRNTPDTHTDTNTQTHKMTYNASILME